MIVLFIVFALVCAGIAGIGLVAHVNRPVENKPWDENNFNGMHARRPSDG